MSVIAESLIVLQNQKPLRLASEGSELKPSDRRADRQRDKRNSLSSDSQAAGQAGGLSMANHIGWECAWEMANTHAARLTPAQHIACVVTTMRHPDRASLEFIALACRVMGKRT